MICPACTRDFDKLVIHHWFELPNMNRYEKRICIGCNGILTQRHFYNPENIKLFNTTYGWYDGHHILPDWDTQELYIINKRNLLARQILKTQTIERIEQYRTHPKDTIDDLVTLILNKLLELYKNKGE